MGRLLFLFLWLGTASASAVATAALGAAAPPRGVEQPLFVELVVNGRPTGEIAQLRVTAGELLVGRDALRRSGLTISGDGEQDVAHTPGLQAHYDSALQTLVLVASPDLTPLSRISGPAHDRAGTVADRGGMLNYDAYIQSSGDQATASLWTEQRVFGPLGVFSNAGTFRAGLGGDGADGYLRYDTRFRYIDEAQAVAFTAGDFISQSLPWTTSVRMAGLQISRDYRVRPDLITTPLPSFAGQTAVPTAVDLFVNGYRQQSASVNPGRFVLDSIPVVNGAGEATVVTTDAVGRQVATTIPFYVSSTLLKPGLVDFSGEVGFLRRNYGLESFDYGQPATSGVVRWGATPQLTVEAHGEATSRLDLAGVGVVWAPWRLGSLSLSAAASHTSEGADVLWTVGYEYTSRRFSVAYQHAESGPGFHDLAGLDLTIASRSRLSDRFVGSLNFSRQGSVGLAYVGGATFDRTRTQLATLSYSRPLGSSASLFFSADRDFGQRTTAAEVRVVIPFGRHSVAAGISRSAGRELSELDYSRSMPSEGGLGVDASLAFDQHGQAYGQDTLTWRDPSVQLQAGGSVAQERGSGWASATGSLVTMANDVFAANQVSDAFAVVSTGKRGVSVAFENQPLGTTDAKGNFFVPNITSYAPVSLGLDTLSLPADQMAVSVERRVTVREGSGALVKMPVRLVRNVVVVLADASGKRLEPGGRVTRRGAPDAEIGWDGLVYLEDVAAHEELLVTRRDGAVCHAPFDVPAGAKALAKIGPVPCR